MRRLLLARSIASVRKWLLNRAFVSGLPLLCVVVTGLDEALALLSVREQDDTLPEIQSQLSFVQTSSPTIPFLPVAIHGTLRCFPEGMPLAYLIATVITGLAILVASHVYISRPEQFCDAFRAACRRELNSPRAAA